MKQLTIGMILPLAVEGGIKTHLLEIIPRLRAKGHKITLVVNSNYKDIVEVDNICTYNPQRFARSIFSLTPAVLHDILQAIKACDLLHIHAYPHFLADYLTITRNYHHKPLVLTFHGSFHQFTDLKTLYLKKVHNLFMLRFAQNIEKFIAVSQAEKNQVIKRGIPGGKVEVIYNGVSDSHVQIQSLQKKESGKKTIIYLGRLANSKNLELLVNAMPYVLKKINNAKLIIAGADWGALNTLKKLASRLGVTSAIGFAGEVRDEQKIDFLVSGDIFVHPSLQDIFSISILEANAAGLPVVAFDTGGNPEMIQDGKTGILVKSFTAEALADSIIKLLVNSKLAEKMGQDSREYTIDKFSWGKTVDRLEILYNDFA
jgi:glycosyltransferase involved in cell wall biosynthesis